MTEVRIYRPRRPTTEEVRHHTTDDVACWFVDANLNGGSFFLGHAYVTYAANPCEPREVAARRDRPRRVGSLNSTVGRLFPSQQREEPRSKGSTRTEATSSGPTSCDVAVARPYATCGGPWRRCWTTPRESRGQQRLSGLPRASSSIGRAADF